MHPEPDNVFLERLRRTQPRPLSESVRRQIGASIETHQRRETVRRLRNGFAWVGLATAAGLALTFGGLLVSGRFNLGESPAPPSLEATGLIENSSGAGMKPVLAQNSLQGRVDEGVVFLSNGLAARRYRYEFIDRVVWQNPADGSMVEMRVPRDEIVLVPVQMF